MGIGPVAQEVSQTFDLFWNSQRAVPMEAFGVDVDAADLDVLREAVAQEIALADDGIYGQAVNSAFISDVAQGRIAPIFAVAYCAVIHS